MKSKECYICIKIVKRLTQINCIYVTKYYFNLYLKETLKNGILKKIIQICHNHNLYCFGTKFSELYSLG